jgi:NAD(P)-dependent dehydrogenase (short-subunit alcohol dehydrogenase family)
VIEPSARYDGRVVLITGGTRGLGLATARVFAAHGAQLVLTHAWGSADERVVCSEIVRAGAPAPLIVQADVTRAEDTASLVATVHERFGTVDALISNASVSLVVGSLDDYTERGFLKSMRGGGWPTFEYLTALRRVCGVYPKYVVVMSSDGPDRFTPGYDFVAAGKAVVETMVKYASYRLRDEGVCINALRSRAIKTESFDGTFGEDFYGFLRTFVPEAWFMTAEEVGRAAFALCSGLFDGVSGQTIMVDRGNTFCDGISYLYERRAALSGLQPPGETPQDTARDAS